MISCHEGTSSQTIFSAETKLHLTLCLDENTNTIHAVQSKFLLDCRSYIANANLCAIFTLVTMHENATQLHEPGEMPLEGGGSDPVCPRVGIPKIPHLLLHELHLRACSGEGHSGSFPADHVFAIAFQVKSGYQK
jgi:hypothetical protein